MTARKKPEDLLPLGRPSTYKPEYCEAIIRFAEAGGSKNAFCGNIGISRQTLYNWMEAHPDFLDATKVAEQRLHEFYENLGKMMATGQLRRLKAERPMLDSNGRPIPDGKGGFLMEREWEPAVPAQAVFIFMTKNLLGWRDKKDIDLGGGTNPDGSKAPVQIEGRFAALTKAEAEARYRELLKKAQEDGQ